jgi:hypothetical protein
MATAAVSVTARLDLQNTLRQSFFGAGQRRGLPFLTLCLLLASCGAGQAGKANQKMETGQSRPRYVVSPRQAASGPDADTAGKEEFYVSPAGTPDGKGTKRKPWDLQTALDHPPEVGPGSVIWLQGGTYRGSFTSRLSGTMRKPITVRGQPGERAIIDPWDPQSTERKPPKRDGLTINGSDTIWRDFEVTDSDPRRSTPFPGSSPRTTPRWRGHGIMTFGARTKLINLVVHDSGDGIGFWERAVDAEIYGCVIYNNGWDAPDRGHGHGIYINNRVGTKRIVDVISVNNFATGMKGYSQQFYVNGLTFEGVMAANNGAPAYPGTPNRFHNMLVGTTTNPVDSVTLRNCYFFQPNLSIGGGVRLGYTAVNNGTMTVQNCYFASGSQNLSSTSWQHANVHDNFFNANGTSNSGPQLSAVDQAGGTPYSAFSWDRNRYFTMAPKPFQLNNVQSSTGSQVIDYTLWKVTSGWDVNSTYTASRPPGIDVFVRPNQYEAGRANIAVFNWAGAGQVSVDVSNVLSPGDSFEVRNAQDYYGAPVLTGTYTGQPLSISMVGLRVVNPIGYGPLTPNTAPDFGVFVLLKK